MSTHPHVDVSGRAGSGQGSSRAAYLERLDLSLLLAGLSAARCTGILLVRSHTTGAVGHIHMEAGLCKGAQLGLLVGGEALSAIHSLGSALLDISVSPSEEEVDLAQILEAAQRR